MQYQWGNQDSAKGGGGTIIGSLGVKPPAYGSQKGLGV